MYIVLKCEAGRKSIKGVQRNAFDQSNCDKLLDQPLCKMREICILTCRCTSPRGI